MPAVPVPAAPEPAAPVPDAPVPTVPSEVPSPEALRHRAKELGLHGYSGKRKQELIHLLRDH